MILCDNMSTVSTTNKLFTSKAPMCYIVQALASWATLLRCNVSVNHLAGSEAHPPWTSALSWILQKLERTNLALVKISLMCSAHNLDMSASYI